MRAYLQANGGARSVTDEEIEACTAEKIGAQKLFCKLQLIQCTMFRKAVQNYQQAFPMRAYLQANVGTARAVDEETEVCTAYKTELKTI